MISIVLYGRNDNYGYNLHKRAALSLNCIAELLTAANDEIIFVDYNTPDDFPTFPEAIQDTLTSRAKRRLRILRVRPHLHARYAQRTHLQALEPIARNVAVRRSNPANRWILSTNTDMIFVPRRRRTLSTIAAKAPDGFYHLPRFEVPESLWEAFDRSKPVQVIRQLSRWGRMFHLNEIVYMNDIVRFDGPGDFQMILREDLFRIHGFDERMLVGWHVDSNIAKRLTLLREGVSDLLDDLYGYHCDHTRQVTPAHRPGGIQNDLRMFFENVGGAELKHQAADWGLANESIEEIRLDSRSSLVRSFLGDRNPYLGALRAAIDSQMSKPTSIAYAPDWYDRIGYDAEHVVPFLVDAIASYPRDICLGWFGSRRDLLVRFASAWRAMEFVKPILVADQSDWLGEDLPAEASFAKSQTIACHADVFVFDFGLPAHATPDGSVPPPHADRALTRVARGLREMARAEQLSLLRPQATPRRFIAVNALHNQFERLVRSHIGAASAPMSTRLRQGFVVIQPDTRKLLDLFSFGHAGARVGDRIVTVPNVSDFIIYGPRLDLEAGVYCFRLRFEAGDLPTADELISPLLLLEVISLPYMIAYHVLTPSDLELGEIAVTFAVTESLLKVAATLGVEFRLKTDGRVSVSLLDAVLEKVPCAHRSVMKEFEWLPLMTVGNAGERHELAEVDAAPDNGSATGTSVRCISEGFVIFGPYWDLLPGRYELAIDLELNEGGNVVESEDGLVLVDVVARRRFQLARLTIPRRGLQSGTQRVQFVVPSTPSRLYDAMDLEFRVRVVGRVPFSIQSVRTTLLSEDFNWLPLMSVADAGEYCDAASMIWAETSRNVINNRAATAMSRSFGLAFSNTCVRAKGEGLVLSGPDCELLSGWYELAVDFLASASEADTNERNDGAAVLEVRAAGSVCLGELFIGHPNLRRTTHRLEFRIPPDLQNGHEPKRLQFQVRSIGHAKFAIESIRTRPLPVDIEWLPLMSVGQAGERLERIGASSTSTMVELPVSSSAGLVQVPPDGLCVRSTGEGFVVFGPYCDLIAGTYELSIDFHPDPHGATPANETEGAVVIDVLAQGHLCLAEKSVSGSDLIGTQHLDFTIPDELAADDSAMRLEFRVCAAGVGSLIIRSVRTRQLRCKTDTHLSTTP